MCSQQKSRHRRHTHNVWVQPGGKGVECGGADFTRHAAQRPPAPQQHQQEGRQAGSEFEAREIIFFLHYQH